ncbi:MAG: hypothetical protein L3J79_06965 [Candidatus Marinimicrobia bacterium]|nr:hypothetical protein [Candidatus Neomarinimicrobiota bacterium]
MPKRKFAPGGQVRVSLILPKQLHKDLEILLKDPVIGKTQYGARSRLVTKLLAQWVKEQRILQEEKLKNKQREQKGYTTHD